MSLRSLHGSHYFTEKKAVEGGGPIFTLRYLRLVNYGPISVDTQVKTVIRSLQSGGKHCAPLEL